MKIVHYANGVMVTDVAKTTDGNGKITWTTSWPSTGEQTYYAYFEGDTTYAKSLSAGQTVSPIAKTSITCGIGPGISVPKGEPVIIWGTLRDSSGHGLANKEVYIVGDVNAKLITDASGNFSMIGGISRGTCFLCYIFVHSEFHGDGNYLASESAGYGVIA